MRHKISLQHQSKFQLSDKQVNFLFFAKKINCFDFFLYYGEFLLNLLREYIFIFIYFCRYLTEVLPIAKI